MVDYELRLENVQNALKSIAERLEFARGEEEISECILGGVAGLCNESCFETCSRMSEVFRKFQRHEGILYALPYYRDHFTHAFHVFSLGYVTLSQWFTELAFLQAGDLGRRYWLLKEWFIASVLHDIAYPIEMAESWVPQFPPDVLGVDIELRSTFDWSPALSGGQNMRHLDGLAAKFVSQLPNDLDDTERARRGVAFKQWFVGQLLERHDHGALAGISLPSLGWALTDEDCAYGAALDIVLHNYHWRPHPTLRQLALSSYPLSALLAYCDTAQEWGRPRASGVAGRRAMPEGTLKFYSVLVERAATTVTLSYDIEALCKNNNRNWGALRDREKRDRIDEQRQSVFTDLEQQTSGIPKAWATGTANHSLRIRACDVNGENIGVLPFLV